MDIFYKTSGRDKFLSRLKAETARSQENGNQFCLLIIRLSRLRDINQEYGYEFADQTVQELNKIIKNHLGQSGYVAKIGDKDFGVILSGTRGTGDGILFANKILEACNEPVNIDGTGFKIRVHIGVANFPDNAQTHMELLKCADLATIKAGKNHESYYVFDSPGEQDTTTMFSMEDELEKAIEKGQIDYYYQPKVDIATGRVSGFEILSRWNSDKWGAVRPDLFIAAAERSNLITELTIDSLTKTLKEFAELQSNGDGPAYTLSINLSAKILNNPDSMERVINTVNIWCDNPGALVLEITEGAIMTDPEAAQETLGRLHNTGIKISIDDFGTGYSSLSYLKKLPVDELKIDKSFVMDLVNSEDDIKIVQTIIDLAGNFNLLIVAEGVENKETVVKLREMGCSQAQGYFISKPIPFEMLLPWLENWDKEKII